MNLKACALCALLTVSTLATARHNFPPEYYLLEQEELKFLSKLDWLFYEHPNSMDYLFLAGFGMDYKEWKELFFDELESDLVDEDCDQIECCEETVLGYIGKLVTVEQIPCDGSR